MPNANAVCERFQKSVRQECLDYLFVLGQRHLYRIIKAYVAYFNLERPHQELDRGLPIPSNSIFLASDSAQPIRVLPVLGDCITCTAERHEQTENDLRRTF